MVQTINGLCKLSIIGRPTFLNQNSKKKCKRHPVVRKINQNKKLGVEDGYFFCSSVVLQIILLIIAICPPFPFLLFGFLFKRVSLLPCHVAAAFDLWKPSHMSDSREDVNMLFTEWK